MPCPEDAREVLASQGQNSLVLNWVGGLWLGGVRGFLFLGCLWNEGQVVICQTTSIVTNRLKGVGSRKCLRLMERHVSHLQEMDEILYGTKLDCIKLV